jgi:hypothetical protein
MEKRAYLISTLSEMSDLLNDDRMAIDIGKIQDTIAHAAPEILDNQWMRIYRYCISNIQDETNPNHYKCYLLYNKKYTEYKDKYL